MYNLDDVENNVFYPFFLEVLSRWYFVERLDYKRIVNRLKYHFGIDTTVKRIEWIIDNEM